MKTSLCIKPEVESISLNDCLACSGCITEEESQRFKSDLECLEDKTTLFSFIISRETKKNLKNLYPALDYFQFEIVLTGFLKKHFNTFLVVDTSYFLKHDKDIDKPVTDRINEQRLDRNALSRKTTAEGITEQLLSSKNLYQQSVSKEPEDRMLLERKKSNILISSECPAVVLYIERVYTDLIKYLDTSLTYQQIAARFVRQKLKENGEIEEESRTSHKIISIQMCYDKKDELKRDNSGIDFFIGSYEFYQFIKEKLDLGRIPDLNLMDWERSYLTHIKTISGLENCINLFNRIKNINIKEKDDLLLAESSDDLVSELEMRLCKGGCFHGPAQVPEGKIDSEDFKDLEKSQFYYKTIKRVFNKPKKTTFKIDW